MSALQPEHGHEDTSLNEERLRAGVYSLLAGLLRSPPDEEMLKRLEGIESQTDKSLDGIATAWVMLKAAAMSGDLSAMNDEYHALFIGLGRGELVPYGSWYITGFLMEKPLSALRQDLTLLGYERQTDVHEPEDHAAAICEIMAMLILDTDISFDRQRQFFATHIGPWIEIFFQDLEKAQAAQFYRAVGRLGFEFIKLEKRYFSMLV